MARLQPGPTQSDYYGKAEPLNRPSAMEGREITEEIVRRYKLEYLGRAFGVSHQAISKWLGPSKDIFTRMRYFLRDLLDDGDSDLVKRIVRLFCNVIDCDPVPRHSDKINFLSLMKVITANNKESADVQIAVTDMFSDMQADTTEIERCIHETQEEIEAAHKLLGQLQFLLGQARQSGGTVSISVDNLLHKVNGSEEVKSRR